MDIIITVGDIMSTVGDIIRLWKWLSTVGESSTTDDTPHSHITIIINCPHKLKTGRLKMADLELKKPVFVFGFLDYVHTVLARFEIRN